MLRSVEQSLSTYTMFNFLHQVKDKMIDFSFILLYKELMLKCYWPFMTNFQQWKISSHTYSTKYFSITEGALYTISTLKTNAVAQRVQWHCQWLVLDECSGSFLGVTAKAGTAKKAWLGSSKLYHQRRWLPGSRQPLARVTVVRPTLPSRERHEASTPLHINPSRVRTEFIRA